VTYGLRKSGITVTEVEGRTETEGANQGSWSDSLHTDMLVNKHFFIMWLMGVQTGPYNFLPVLS